MSNGGVYTQLKEAWTQGVSLLRRTSNGIGGTRGLASNSTAVLCGIIGVGVGLAVPTALVIGAGLAYLPLIPLGPLVTAPTGLLLGRICNGAMIAEPTDLDRLFGRRDGEIEAIEATRTKLPANDPEIPALTRQITDLHKLNVPELMTRYGMGSKNAPAYATLALQHHPNKASDNDDTEAAA